MSRHFFFASHISWCVFLLASSFASAGGSVSPSPALIAYRIDGAMEKDFVAPRSAPSDFWLAFKREYAPSLRLVPMNTKALFPRQSDDLDAQVVARAAWGAKGLYMLFEIEDDQFTSGLSGNDWANDMIDLFINGYSSEQLKADSGKRFLQPQTGLTLTHVQISCKMGGTLPPDSIQVNSAYLYGGKDAKELVYKNLTPAEAKKRFGIDLRTFEQSKTRRSLEMLVPWSALPSKVEPKQGERLGLHTGYNDVDAYDLDVRGMDNGILPKGLSNGGVDNPHRSRDSWGDLELGPALVQYVVFEQRRRVAAEPVFHPEGFYGTEVSEHPLPGLKKGPDLAGKVYYCRQMIDATPVFMATTFATDRESPPTPKVISADGLNKSMRKPVRDSAASKIQYLVVDKNGNRDLSDDPRIPWKSEEDTVFNGLVMKRSGFSCVETLVVNNDTAVCLFKDTGSGKAILMRRLDCVAGTCSLFGKQYKAALWDKGLSGYSDQYSRTIGVDLDRNGVINAAVGSKEVFTGVDSFMMVDSMRFFVRGVLEGGRGLVISPPEKGSWKRYDACAGAQAPPITGKDRHGNGLSLDGILKQNDYAFVYFLSDYCGACDKLGGTAPSGIDDQVKFLGSEIGKVGVLAVNMEVADTLPRRYSMIAENQGWGGPMFSRYHINGTPTLLVVDKRGRILVRGGYQISFVNLWKALGRKDWEEAEKRYTKFLGNPYEGG